MYTSQQRQFPIPPPNISTDSSTNRRLYGGGSGLDGNSLVQLIPASGNGSDPTSGGLTPDLHATSQFLKDPYSPEFWQQTLTRIFHHTITDQIRHIYEACLRLFPLSVRCWKGYIEHEINCGNLNHAKELFQRCLPHILHIDLYKLYIEYVKTIHKGHEDEYAAQIQMAYEQVLDTIAYDVKSFPIWTGYIDFLKQIRVTNEMDKKFQQDTIRLAYQRALSLPIANANVLGRQYEDFLNATIPVKAQIDALLKHSNRSDTQHAFICKIRDKHMTFSSGPRGSGGIGNNPSSQQSDVPPLRVPNGSDCDFPVPFPILAKQLNFKGFSPAQLSSSAQPSSHFDTTSTTSSVSPIPIPGFYTKYGTHLDPWVGCWRSIINYERSNPQRVQFNVLRARVIFSFKKAMPYCLHSIQYWYDFISYLQDELSGGNTGDSSAISTQHLAQGSTLYGLDTVYGGGLIDYTSDESSIKTIAGLVAQSANIQSTFNPNTNARYEREHMNKSVFFSLASRLKSKSDRLQQLIYSTWELGLQFMGYSPLYRTIYVNYAIKYGLPVDDYIQQQTKSFILQLGLLPNQTNPTIQSIPPNLNQNDTTNLVKRKLYLELNENIKSRAEQLLFTLLLESEHDLSIGTTLAFQLPLKHTDIKASYGDWRHLLFSLSQTSSDIYNHLLNFIHTNGRIGYPAVAFTGETLISTVQSGNAMITAAAAKNGGGGSGGQNEGEQSTTAMTDGPQQSLAILSPLGSSHANSVLISKEDASAATEQPQVQSSINVLNINSTLTNSSNSLSAVKQSIFFLITNQANLSVDLADTTPSVPLPLTPYLFSTIVNVLPYRTSVEALEEFPILNWLEYKRLSTGLISTENLWNCLRKAISPSLFNANSWYYLADQFAISGNATKKSKIPAFYQKAKESLLQKHREKLLINFKSQLSSNPAIYTQYIDKVLLIHELGAVWKYAGYLEKNNDLSGAKTEITTTLTNQILLTDLDLVHYFTKFYHKLLSLTVAIGGTETGTSVLSDEQGGIATSLCLADLYTMQMKRAAFLNLTENITVLNPTETQNNQITQQNQQAQLQLLQINAPVLAPGQSTQQQVAQQRGSTTMQQLLSATTVKHNIELAAAASSSFMDGVDPLGATSADGGHTTVIEIVEKMTANVPIEGNFELLSSVFPNYLSKLSDPITLTTFKHLSTITPPLGGIGGSATSGGVGDFLSGSGGLSGGGGNTSSSSSPFSSTPLSSTQSTAQLDSEAQALHHDLTQPVQIQPQKQHRNANFNQNYNSQPQLHHRAPILRKLTYDEQRNVSHVFTMPNLQRFTPYDPRAHSKLTFPTPVSYSTMVPHMIQRKVLVVDESPSDNTRSNPSGDGNDSDTTASTGVKLKVKFDEVDVENQYRTTTALTQAPTFEYQSNINDQGIGSQTITDGTGSSGYPFQQHQNKPNTKQESSIQISTNTVQVFNTTTGRYSQAVSTGVSLTTSSATLSSTGPFIGLVWYNNFGLLTNIFAPRRVTLSSNFLYLYKATLASIRSPQEILPQLPTLHYKDVFRHQTLAGGTGGGGGGSSSNNAGYTQQDQQDYNKERDQEYTNIQNQYINEINNIDRRATFILLTQAISVAKTNTAGLGTNPPGSGTGPGGAIRPTATPQLAFTVQEEKLQHFSRENVADIILRSVSAIPMGSVILKPSPQQQQQQQQQHMNKGMMNKPPGPNGPGPMPPQQQQQRPPQQPQPSQQPNPNLMQRPMGMGGPNMGPPPSSGPMGGPMNMNMGPNLNGPNKPPSQPQQNMGPNWGPPGPNNMGQMRPMIGPGPSGPNMGPGPSGPNMGGMGGPPMNMPPNMMNPNNNPNMMNRPPQMQPPPGSQMGNWNPNGPR